MSGIACLCVKAEIGKAELVDQVHLLLKMDLIRLLPVKGMGEQGSQEKGLNEEIKKKEAGFSHRRQSRLFTRSSLMS